MIAEHAAEVWVRRYNGVRECDVVVGGRGQEMSLRCRDYNEAVKWARIDANLQGRRRVHCRTLISSALSVLCKPTARAMLLIRFAGMLL